MKSSITQATLLPYMRTRSLSFSIIILLLAFSCTKSTVPTEQEYEFKTESESTEMKSGPDTYTGDNTQTLVDWAGTYFEVLPCVNCEGIETWVSLKPDGTFELKTNYLGLNDAREETFTGKFTWDETGSRIQLQGLIGDAPGKYKVGENQIWHLDKNGNCIEGALADRYILRKK